jgi:hypothetical protein
MATTNVPSEQFGGSWVATVENTFAWIEGNAPADYMCVNGIHPLIRENTATSWPVQGYIDWLNGMKRLWNGFGSKSSAVAPLSSPLGEPTHATLFKSLHAAICSLLRPFLRKIAPIVVGHSPIKET